MNKKDQQLIDGDIRTVQSDMDKFFNYFGLRDEEHEYAEKEYQQFLEDFKEAKMGRGFFDSPLGRKSFMVGFFRGRNTLRPIPKNDFEKE